MRIASAKLIYLLLSINLEQLICRKFSAILQLRYPYLE